MEWRLIWQAKCPLALRRVLPFSLHRVECGFLGSVFVSWSYVLLGNNPTCEFMLFPILTHFLISFSNHSVSIFVRHFQSLLEQSEAKINTCRCLAFLAGHPHRELREPGLFDASSLKLTFQLWEGLT